jgi:hypothetical protein
MCPRKDPRKPMPEEIHPCNDTKQKVRGPLVS